MLREFDASPDKAFREWLRCISCAWPFCAGKDAITRPNSSKPGFGTANQSDFSNKNRDF